MSMHTEDWLKLLFMNPMLDRGGLNNPLTGGLAQLIAPNKVPNLTEELLGGSSPKLLTGLLGSTGSRTAGGRR